MKNVYKTAWSPRAYLTQYYTTPKIAEDEFYILKFIINFFKNKKLHFDEMIEVGCGPTIHHALPFVPYVDKIYMADFLNENLLEIKKWVSGKSNAHDWNPYVRGLSQLEWHKQNLATRRTREFRKKLSGLLKCNIFRASPIGSKKQFGLVTSFYCLECASQSKNQWVKSFKNISSLVSQNGWIIVSALRNAKHYLVNKEEFPATSIRESDIHSALLKNGFSPDTIKIEVHKVGMWESEGFESILIACAQKRKQENSLKM